MNQVQYDEKESCNSCGIGQNEVKVTSHDCGYISECETKCKDCGFTDYWAYGFFESGSYMVGKSKKYSFGVKSNG